MIRLAAVTRGEPPSRAPASIAPHEDRQTGERGGAERWSERVGGAGVGDRATGRRRFGDLGDRLRRGALVWRQRPDVVHAVVGSDPHHVCLTVHERAAAETERLTGNRLAPAVQGADLTPPREARLPLSLVQPVPSWKVVGRGQDQGEGRGAGPRSGQR